jgi:SnoaL-like domain
MSELDELRRRVAVLEDRELVLEALYRYAHAVESGTDQDFVDCFTADAAFDIHYGDSPNPIPVHMGKRHEEGVLHEGTEQLAAYIAGTRARVAGNPQLRMLADPIISVDGDEATARSYLVGVMSANGSPVLMDLGRYGDRLRRVAPGEWRIAHRVVEVLVARRA